MDKSSFSYEALQQRVQELEERNRFLENVLDTIPLNVFVKDRESKYCYTNKICDEINGVERGGLLGKSDFDRNTPEEIAKSFRDDDSMIMESRKGSRLLSPEYCGDKINYYNILKEPLINASDEVIGVLGIVMEAQASETPYSTEILEHCDGMVFDYSIESKKSIILKPLESFDLFSRDCPMLEDILQKKRLFPDDIPLLKNILQQVHAGEEKISALLRFYDNEHSLRWCKLFFNCVYDKHMQPVRALGILTPLSSSIVEAEKRKLETDKITEQLMNILGKRYDAFVYINEAENYYQVLYERGLLKNFKHIGTMKDYYAFCQQYLHSGDYDTSKTIPKNLEKAEGFRAEEGFLAQEIRFLTEDGTYRWKEFEFFPIKNEHSSGVLVTIFDVDNAVKKKQKQRLKEINNDIIDILSTVVEFRSVESGDHIQRIKGFTKIMLKYVNEMYDEVNYTPELIDVISSASAMHDIGKVAIPDSILLKPGKLTAEEFEEMKTHTTRGCDILESMENLQDERYYKYSYEICRYHHERFDGRGYPDGLRGDDIPLEAQIVSVADVYDALISKRVYKDAYSLDEAYQMILNGECGVFSPRLMECFKCAKDEMESFSREQFMVK